MEETLETLETKKRNCEQRIREYDNQLSGLSGCNYTFTWVKREEVKRELATIEQQIGSLAKL